MFRARILSGHNLHMYTRSEGPTTPSRFFFLKFEGDEFCAPGGPGFHRRPMIASPFRDARSGSCVCPKSRRTRAWLDKRLRCFAGRMATAATDGPYSLQSHPFIMTTRSADKLGLFVQPHGARLPTEATTRMPSQGQEVAVQRTLHPLTASLRAWDAVSPLAAAAAEAGVLAQGARSKPHAAAGAATTADSSDR